MKGIVLRMATGGAVVAAGMTIIALPASAAVPTPVAPLVSVASPNPGDYWRRGQIWVSGVACDPNAMLTDATGGIGKVAIYLGDRDTTAGAPWYRPGGYFGSASSSTAPDFSSTSTQSSRLGLTSPDVSTCKQRLSGFRVLTSSIKKGIYDMNIYVQGKSGMETKVTIAGLRIDHP